MITLDAIWAKKNEYHEKIQKAYNEIKNNNSMIEELQIQAKEKNAALDSIIRREAIRTVDMDYDKMR
jgi:hypothetical protein